LERAMVVDITTAAPADRSEESGTVILRLNGELDLAGREAIETPILASILFSWAVMFDLEKLTFCDSSGLAMFVTANRRAEEVGTTVSLRNLQPAVRRVFAISGVDQVVRIVE
jgi:anti-sigma B factor antagonist